MPVVVMQPSGHTTISGSRNGPSSHMGLAIFTCLCINPLFGVFALGFACSSRSAAPVDWEDARVKGKISMFISIAGIVLTVTGVLIFVMIFYTKDS